MVQFAPRSFTQVSKAVSQAASVGLLATLTIGSWVATGISSPAAASLEDSPKTVVDEVWQVVNTQYVDKRFNQTDWLRTRQELLSRNYTDKKQAYEAIRQALEELGDSHTRFLDPEQYQELTSKTSGELSGVGLRFNIEQQTNKLTVTELIENSPATQAGIQVGDQIVRINGKPTSLMTLKQASEEIQGKVGTQVSLYVARKGRGAFDVTLTRETIELPAVSHALKQEGSLRVGYIKLDEFSSHAAEQMKQAIEDLNDEQVTGFVLDLRGNPGGLLFSSIDIARMWMPDGAIVRTVDREAGDKKEWANNTALTDLPLVILVDRGSASASEILAGALKESKRATVVGSRTYGKGTVQAVHNLSDGSGIVVTVARYYPPSGTDINKKGIRPDVELNLTPKQQSQLESNPALVGTNADPQYSRAIAVLTNQSRR